MTEKHVRAADAVVLAATRYVLLVMNEMERRDPNLLEWGRFVMALEAFHDANCWDWPVPADLQRLFAASEEEWGDLPVTGKGT
jgi:uncharacterized membrane protein